MITLGQPARAFPTVKQWFDLSCLFWNHALVCMKVFLTMNIRFSILDML